MWRLFIFCIFIGCGFNSDRIIRKRVTQNQYTINWFYYSYITNLSPDKISISNGQTEIEIYEGVDVITDVFIEKENIIIKLYKPERGIVYTENPLKEIFGFKILIDSNSTSAEHRNIPHGEIEKN